MQVFATAARPALALLGLLGLGLTGCQVDVKNNAPAPSAGTADFSQYIAVGNSLTSGYSDGGLYNEAQATSYPAILAQQFRLTGKGPASFVQPAFSDAHKDGSGYVKLQVVNGAVVPVPPSQANGFLGEQVAYTGASLPSGQLQLEPYSGPQPDNLGVPGISVLSSLNALTGGLAPYGVINPFYERLLPAADKQTKDYVTYIGQKNATFFTCWLGNNDVLTYATNGGAVSPTNPFSNLTDSTRFGIGYRAVLQTLTKNRTVKGAVAFIPNVTGIPYFTTVTTALVNAKFAASVPAGSTTPAPVLFIVTGKGTVRAATARDLLILPSQAIIGTASTNPLNPFPVGAGYSASLSNPLPTQYVLDQDEVTAVVNRTTQLNAIISKSAATYQVATVDMAGFFASAAALGVTTNGVNNSVTYATGNIFSLDGVHPTPRGYALIANEWLRVINVVYGSNIPYVNPNNYRAVLFP